MENRIGSCTNFRSVIYNRISNLTAGATLRARANHYLIVPDGILLMYHKYIWTDPDEFERTRISKSGVDGPIACIDEDTYVIVDHELSGGKVQLQDYFGKLICDPFSPHLHRALANYTPNMLTPM